MFLRIAIFFPMFLLFVGQVRADGPPATVGDLKAEVVNCATIANPAAEVLVKEYTFEPNEIKVPAGSVVKWTNKGSVSHMITSGAPGANPGACFGTGFVTVNQSVCVKFINPGVYDYFCRPHGNLMKGGKVAVE